jgi:hypothetical protein
MVVALTSEPIHDRTLSHGFIARFLYVYPPKIPLIFGNKKMKKKWGGRRIKGR